MRIRITFSTGVSHTFPSPILSVRAAVTMASTIPAASASSVSDLHPHLGDEVDGVLGTPVDLGVAPLPAEALHLGHGHALDAQGPQRLFDVVDLERLDDCGHKLHVQPTLPMDPNSPAA